MRIKFDNMSGRYIYSIGYSNKVNKPFYTVSKEIFIELYNIKIKGSVFNYLVQ